MKFIEPRIAVVENTPPLGAAQFSRSAVVAKKSKRAVKIEPVAEFSALRQTQKVGLRNEATSGNEERSCGLYHTTSIESFVLRRLPWEAAVALVGRDGITPPM